MIPVLIVDDEYLIRGLVRESIDWEALGFSVIAEAEDGEEALRLADELRPKLMIVDINIPFVNGLDLSLRLRAAHPDIRVVILTGYEDFQFARKAIKIGVVDYLLKPIVPEDLEKAVVAAREAILRGEEDRRLASADRSRSKEDALRALVSGAGPAGGGFSRSFSFEVDLERGETAVCLFDIDPPASAEELRPLLGIPCELFRCDGGALALLAGEDARTVRVKDKAYYAACERVLAHFRGRTVAVGVGGAARGLSGLPEAFRRASAALEESYYLGVNRVNVYDAGRTPLPGAAKPPGLPPRESMLMSLRSGSGKELADAARTLFRELGRLRADRQYCEMLCLELLLVVNEYLQDLGLSAAELLGTGDDYYSVVRGFRTLEETGRRMVELIARGGAAAEAQGGTRTKLVVRKARQFIERNYARKHVTLEHAAENATVSASYLSSIFKKETGLSVIEFLTNTRLDAAKRIMDEDPLTAITDVADRAGYSDPYYFSKCFRKRFGLAPTAYLRKKGPAPET